MTKDFWNKFFTPFKRVFKSEDSKFLVSVGLKVSGISFIISCFVYFLLFEFTRLNHAFFVAHGFPLIEDGSFFYEFISQEATDNLLILFSFHVFLFFIGTYVGWLILRPFRMIAEYCDQAIENPNVEFKVDDFSNYRLLTHFAEFFFEFIRESRRRGVMVTNSIPPQYARVHRPTLDKIFMLHFGLLLIIITICSVVFISENAASIFNGTIELASQTLKDSRTTGRFFKEQSFLLNDTVVITIILSTCSYIALGFHLYGKVSGAAFGIFSTMRAFMKGKYSNRVHLLGFPYLRDYTRRINKYLDFIENNLVKRKDQ
jgi:hypothetical protein